MSTFTPNVNANYPGAVISEGATIHEGCRIDPGAQISTEAVLKPYVVINKNVKIFGKVLLDRKVKICENVTLMGPLHIGEGTYIAPNAVIGVIRAKTTDLSWETRIGENCRIGKGTEILAGVKVGSHARVRAGSRVIGDIPQYGLASHNPAILERYACPKCSGPLDIIRVVGEVCDTRCEVCRAGEWRFNKIAWSKAFNRVLLPNNAFGETVPTLGDDPRWSDEKELT